MYIVHMHGYIMDIHIYIYVNIHTCACVYACMDMLYMYSVVVNNTARNSLRSHLATSFSLLCGQPYELVRPGFPQP